MKKRIAIYARVSTEKQSYERQVEELTRLAKQHGYSEIDVFAEQMSGYKKNERVQLQTLLNKIEENPQYYQKIYTAEISRLGRNPTDTRSIVDRLTDLGVPIYIQSLNQSTIDDSGKRNMIMNIILQVLIEYANQEAETFKVRSKSGLLKSAREGKAGGGSNLPYGYKRDDNKMLVIEPEEAKVVKEIFELYSKGNGVKVISNILNDQGVPTRMNKTHSSKTVKFKVEKNGASVKWSDKTVLDIIKNPLMKGERRFKGEILEAPAIIKPELWNECNRICESKTHRHYQTTYTYLLKNLCTCGKCGRNYFAKYKPVPQGDKVYICSSRLHKEGNCGNVGVNISLLESSLYDQLVNTPRILKYISNTKGVKEKLDQDIEKLNLQIKLDGKLIQTKSKESEKILDLYLSDAINKTVLKTRQTKVENEIESLNKRIELSKRELAEKKKALVNLSNTKSTKKMLEEAAGNRNQLQTIYNQIIQQVIINGVDKNNVLVTVWFKINDTVLPTPVKMMLDTGGLIKKPAIFRYKALGLMESEPRFKKNLLISKPLDTIKEFESPLCEWTEIDKILRIQ